MEAIIVFSFIILIAIVGLVYFSYFDKKTTTTATKEVDYNPVFGQVYNHAIETGTLESYSKGTYRFSTQILKRLMRTSNIAQIPIDNIHKAKYIKGVGWKVFALIKALVKDYREYQSAIEQHYQDTNTNYYPG